MKLSMLEKREFTAYLSRFDFLEQIRNKTFLITGAGGMTGTGIIKWLLLENEEHGANVKIYASTRKPYEVPDYVEAGDAITFCMFGTELDTLSNISFDYIIHGAAPTGRKFFVSKPAETFRVIVDDTENLLELARKNAGCRFLYLSSMDVYGVIRSESPIVEEYVSAIDSLNIRNGYPLGKKGAEFLCRAYHEEYGVDAVIIRPASIQGLLQPYEEARVFNEILRCILEKKDLVLKSDGSVKKCFIYSLDAISATFTVLLKGRGGKVYNATNPETFMTLRDLAQHLFDRFCPENKIVYDIQDEKTLGFLPLFSFVQDIRKLRELGWMPFKKLDDIYAVDIERFSNINE